MNPIEQSKQFIVDNSLIKKKETVILAVSGGPDSIFLLELFAVLAREFSLRVIVGHFNHMLREEADAEELFVKKMSKKYGFEFVGEAKDVNSFYAGDSIEQTARFLRYDFFMKLSREFKAKKIVLGHHKDDLVETVMLRIIRGSGLMGLKAMQPLTKYKRIYLLRPLLHIEKTEILSYLDLNKIEYAIDKSNFEDLYLRNKVRNNILPLMTEANPNIKNAFLNLTTTLARDYDYIYNQTLDFYKSILISHKSHVLRVDSTSLLKVHPSLSYNVIRYCLQQVKGNLRRLELKHSEEIMDLLKNRPVKSVVDLPDCLVIKEIDELLFKRL